MVFLSGQQFRRITGRKVLPAYLLKEKGREQRKEFYQSWPCHTGLDAAGFLSQPGSTVTLIGTSHERGYQSRALWWGQPVGR
jgi:hypothetical protein